MARPSFQPTKEQRHTVSVAAGAGMSHEEIAIGLGIDRGTLAKYFERELSVGAYERRLEVFDAMHVAALKGNVAAQKAYAERTPRAAAPPQPPEGDEKPAAIGKKQQANVDAKTAHVGTGWEEILKRPPPPLQ